MATTACRFCGYKVNKGPLKCVNCLQIFHVSCTKALKLEQVSETEVVCCEKKHHHANYSPLDILDDIDSDKEEVTNKQTSLIDFLKSEDFSTILKTAVDTATKELKEEVLKVQTEVNNLKLSNIELVRFLSSGFTVKAAQPIRMRFAAPCAQSSIPVFRRDGPKPANI